MFKKGVTVMKYFENPKSKKGGLNTGFYITVICCLVAVGAAAWFALSRSSSTVPQSDPQSKPDQSYNDPSSSYNDNEPSIQPPPTEQTQNPVIDVPYEEPIPEPEAEPKQALIMPVTGEIIKEFSDTALQFSATYCDLRLHTGLDIAAKNKTAVYASGDGTVKSVEESGALGNFVTIEHRDGIVFKYCGLETINVASGQKVTMGEAIGTVGTVPCECMDSEHLHLEAYIDGKAVSPMDIIGVLD